MYNLCDSAWKLYCDMALQFSHSYLFFSSSLKYEDELISPKQFVHMSGKATLKDWKRAIRMGGVMLR